MIIHYNIKNTPNNIDMVNKIYYSCFCKPKEKEVNYMRLNATKVRLLMAKQVINQASLAAKAGISRQTLSAVMNGRNCRPELLGKISRALGVDPEEIIE